MDKIIGTINNNLRSVINSIREHLSESEKYLARVNDEMDKKVSLAAGYKEQVSASKNTINRIEEEIDSLEKDLNDLNAKFGGTDFKEILSAGNKEINTKIIEKRAVIQRESQKILNLTEQARQIKEELIELREKKDKLEEDIKNTKVVERFYSTKVNEIIDYVEAGNDIELYIDNTPQTELLVNDEREDQLVEVSTALNDRVFEEIDEIALGEPDQNLVEEAIKNVVNVTFIKPEPKTTPVEATPVEETKVEDGIPAKTFHPIVTEDLTKKAIVEETVTEEVAEDGIAEKTFQPIVTEDLTKKPVEEVKEETKEGPESIIGDRSKFVANVSGCSEEMLKTVVEAMRDKNMSKEFIESILLDAGRTLPTASPEELIGDRDTFVKRLGSCSGAMFVTVVEAMKKKEFPMEFINEIVREAGRGVEKDTPESVIDDRDTFVTQVSGCSEEMLETVVKAMRTKGMSEDFIKDIIEEAGRTLPTTEVEESAEDDLTEEKQPEEKKKEDKKKKLENPLTIEDAIEKTLENEKFPVFDGDIDLNSLLDDVDIDIPDDEDESDLLPGEDVEDDTPIIGSVYEEDADDSVIEIEIEDDLEINSNLFKEKDAMTGEDVSSLGIDASKLKAEDLNLLLNKTTKASISKKLSVLAKHNIPVEATYSNINVLVNVSAENLDSMLTMLQNVTKDDLSSIVPVLDKVNTTKLEQSIEVNKNKDVIDIIIPAVDEVEDALQEMFSMTDEELETLKSSVPEETYKKMNILQDRVVDNYNYLDGLGIENIRECLTKYPSKLLLDPKDFKETLDKYDLEDLVRCINKNAKVFDKI